MRALICLALLATVGSAQTTFKDPDFDFTVEVPAGLIPLEEAELRAFFRVPDGVQLNRPSDPDDPDNLTHRWMWKDATGRGREMSLFLGKDPRGLPFMNPDDFVRIVSDEPMKLAVEKRKEIEAPRPRIVVEGTRTRSDGAEMRMRQAYLIMGQRTYGILYVQGLAADWPELDEPFQAVFDSLHYPLPQMNKPTGAPGTGPTGPSNRPGAPDSSAPPESWSSLEVAGSLALAAALLMSLIFGGGKR